MLGKGIAGKVSFPSLLFPVSSPSFTSIFFSMGFHYIKPVILLTPWLKATLTLTQYSVCTVKWDLSQLLP